MVTAGAAADDEEGGWGTPAGQGSSGEVGPAQRRGGETSGLVTQRDEGDCTCGAIAHGGE